MKNILHCLLPATYCLLTASAMGQCGPGGCCADGQCGIDFDGWRSSTPRQTQVVPPRVSTPREPAEIINQPSLAGKECFRSVVRIKTVDRDGANTYGSGTAVLWGNRLAILTASHVVREARQIYVHGRTQYHRAWIMRHGQDKTWDVVVLITNTADDFMPAVRLAYRATGHPRPGEVLYSCGFGGDGRLKINRGRFRRYACSMQDMSRADWLILSGSARQGDSGGPIFNTQGELVGVLWGTDGHDVVATQCGRLHVLMHSALGEPTYEVRRKKLEVRRKDEKKKYCPSSFGLQTSLPVRPTGILNRDRGVLTCRPKQPIAVPQPQVIVQNDPAISRKLDVLIQNTMPRPAEFLQEPKEKNEPAVTNPLVMFLVIGGAVVVGFVVYFASQKGS